MPSLQLLSRSTIPSTLPCTFSWLTWQLWKSSIHLPSPPWPGQNPRFYRWMWRPDVFLHLPGRGWLHPARGHGSGPVDSDPSPLRTHPPHELALVCGADGGVPGNGFLLSLPLTALIFRLPFCNNSEIYHFYCDMPAVMCLACADTRVHQTALHVISFIVLSIPLSVVFVSYVFMRRPSYGSGPRKGASGPAPRAPPTCPWSCSMATPASYTCPPGPATLLRQAGWCLWSTPSSLPS